MTGAGCCGRCIHLSIGTNSTGMPFKPMNICLVTNEFPALTETFITTKALELSRRGHQITVIKNQDTNVVNESHVKQVKQARIRVLTYNNVQTKKGIVE